MRLLKSIDLVNGPGNLSEVHVAADMVILVKRPKNALHFLAVHSKIRKRRKKRKSSRNLKIFFDKFAQSHRIKSKRMRRNLRMAH